MFKDELRKLRIENSLTQDELAKKLGLKKSTISMYENGNRQPDLEILEAIADIFNVDMNRLISAKNVQDIFSIKNIIPIQTRKIPLLGEIACGVPIFSDQQHGEYIDCQNGVLADFALKCKGDSMINARIFDGDLVFVKRQPTVNNGEIAVVLIDDEATLKRVYLTESNIMLVAENPAYPPMSFSGSECTCISILGKAVAFQSLIK